MSRAQKGWTVFSIAALGWIFAITAEAVNISVNIPGTYTTSNNPGAVVANFYSFALLIGGILAFGAIVWGGVKYAIAAGNPSAQSDGKDWIVGALLGLVLLASAALILKTINPELIRLNIPSLSPLPQTQPATQAAPVGGQTTQTTPGANGSGGSNGGATPQAPIQLPIQPDEKDE